MSISQQEPSVTSPTVPFADLSRRALLAHKKAVFKTGVGAAFKQFKAAIFAENDGKDTERDSRILEATTNLVLCFEEGRNGDNLEILRKAYRMAVTNRLQLAIDIFPISLVQEN